MSSRRGGRASRASQWLPGLFIAALAGCDPVTSAGIAIEIGDPTLDARAETAVLDAIDSTVRRMQMVRFLPPTNTSAWSACYSHERESMFLCAKRRDGEMHVLFSQPFATRFTPAADSVLHAVTQSLILARGASSIRRCVWQAGATDALSGCSARKPAPASAPEDSAGRTTLPPLGPVGTSEVPLS